MDAATKMDIGSQEDLQPSGSKVKSRKRKVSEGDAVSPKDFVSPTTRERDSFDFFASLKAAKKKLKFGNEVTTLDIQPGTSSDGTMKFRVSWVSGLLDPKTGTKQVFKFICDDGCGKITCTSFDDLARKYAKFVKVGKTYRLTGLYAENENEEYNVSGHHLQIKLQDFSKLEEIEDETIPAVTMDFKTFAEMRQMRVGSMPGLLAIMVKDWGIRQQKGKNLRDITLVDSEMMSGKVTFFDDRAESFKFKEFMPIAISNVAVKWYKNQKTFNIYGEPLIMNPASGDLAVDLKLKFDETYAAAMMEDDS